MLLPRVIPCLLLQDGGLVKTVRFQSPTYVGDPLTTIRIFNEKEADELILLDITASRRRHAPALGIIRDLASECFMPIAYGGGLRSTDQIRAILTSGVEKVVLNTAALENPSLITEAAREFGNQSIVVSIDVRRDEHGRSFVYSHRTRQHTDHDPVGFASKVVGMGAGEIFLNSVDRDGTYEGYDLGLVQSVTKEVGVPVVACGGAAGTDDLRLVRTEAGASAAAAGSIFVFVGNLRSVLITYPRSVPEFDLSEVQV